VLGLKENIGIAAVPNSVTADLAGWFSEAFQAKFEPMQNVLAVSLGNIGQIIHPGIMYGLLLKYEGNAWDKENIPLFYQGVTDEIALILESLSDEIITMTGMLMEKYSIALTGVKPLYKWLLDSYSNSIEDSSTLARAFSSNRSYRGLKIPVIEANDKYVPDFKSRYLTEDIPFGLLYSKAVAFMLCLETPVINKVIRQTEKWIGKTYLGANWTLSGPDIYEARIPQNYGINIINKLLQLNR
jgi:hypothetical protein